MLNVMARDSQGLFVLGDIRILVELAPHAARIALAARTAAHAARPLPNNVIVFDERDDVVERSLSDGLIPVGMSIWHGVAGQGIPSDIRRLNETQHPYALLRMNRGTYLGLRLHNFSSTEVASIHAGVLFDVHDQPILVPDLVRVGMEDFQGAEEAMQRERAEQEAERVKRLAESAVAAADAERIMDEQALRSTSVDVPWTEDREGPIEELHRRVVLEIGEVVWKWWLPEGIDSGGPMTREYGDAVVKWFDGEYYYLQMNDSSHELTPLGQYDSKDAAVVAGKRHSLYTDAERELFEEEAD
jgi:hypothetical protein